VRPPDGSEGSVNLEIGTERSQTSTMRTKL
jgi:hypothetical protein